ncbi:MAG: helix-turn-helix domain-containing protein [Ferrovum myxofaciens]|nr:helix-turn-helix domain-containing protein [Ferrovum myxofaciens]
MYPGTSQTEKLDELLGLHRRVYNTALDEAAIAEKCSPPI